MRKEAQRVFQQRSTGPNRECPDCSRPAPNIQGVGDQRSPYHAMTTAMTIMRNRDGKAVPFETVGKRWSNPPVSVHGRRRAVRWQPIKYPMSHSCPHGFFTNDNGGGVRGIEVVPYMQVTLYVCKGVLGKVYSLG
ncbi:hypothetical protein PM082_001659 [Marasmius tenuissimus]|nr:hypothetical protein PM082_001659 [Marasmius tenuissimus]